MKLIIRDEKPKEDTCEIWLESGEAGNVYVKSRVNDGEIGTEVLFMPHMQKRKSLSTEGNLKWETT